MRRTPERSYIPDIAEQASGRKISLSGARRPLKACTTGEGRNVPL